MLKCLIQNGRIQLALRLHRIHRHRGLTILSFKHHKVALVVKNQPTNAGDTELDPWVGRISWRRAWQPTPVFLPWRIPWTEEPGGLQSMGSQRVQHDRACTDAYIPKMQVILMGSHVWEALTCRRTVGIRTKQRSELLETWTFPAIEAAQADVT